MESQHEAIAPTIVVRRGGVADLEAMISIEVASRTEPWAGALFSTTSSQPSAHVLLAAPGPHLDPVAYLCFLICHDEARIVNLVTVPEHRRHGFATYLLQRLLDDALRSGAQCVMLEVRRSNSVAIELYLGLGFRRVGARPMYYSDHEDALVMLHRLDARCRSPWDRMS